MDIVRFEININQNGFFWFPWQHSISCNLKVISVKKLSICYFKKIKFNQILQYILCCGLLCTSSIASCSKKLLLNNFKKIVSQKPFVPFRKSWCQNFSFKEMLQFLIFKTQFKEPKNSFQPSYYIVSAYKAQTDYFNYVRQNNKLFF